MFSREDAGQATKSTKSYNRPAGHNVSVAGVLSSTIIRESFEGRKVHGVNLNAIIPAISARNMSHAVLLSHQTCLREISCSLVILPLNLHIYL